MSQSLLTSMSSEFFWLNPFIILYKKSCFSSREDDFLRIKTVSSLNSAFDQTVFVFYLDFLAIMSLDRRIFNNNKLKLLVQNMIVTTVTTHKILNKLLLLYYVECEPSKTSKKITKTSDGESLLPQPSQENIFKILTLGWRKEMGWDRYPKWFRLHKTLRYGTVPSSPG